MLLWDVEETQDGAQGTTEVIGSAGVLEMPSILEAGWGIAHHAGPDHEDTILYVTDGTDKITKISAQSWTVLDQISVTDSHGVPIRDLNELELIRDHRDPHTRTKLAGYIFANQWHTDKIHLIKLSTGRAVKSWHLD